MGLFVQNTGFFHLETGKKNDLLVMMYSYLLQNVVILKTKFDA